MPAPKPFRMYVNENCEHCKAAQSLFHAEEVDVIVVGFDPIATRGIQATLNGQFATPVTISYPTQQTIVGNNVEQLNAAINAYRGTGSTGTNAVASKAPVANATKQNPTTK